MKLFPFTISTVRNACLAVAIAGLAACSALDAPVVEGDLLLVDANIVDPATRQIRHGALLITDGRIIEEFTETPASFTGRVVDLDGKWVIPGLIDMHTHSFGNRAPGTPSDAPGTEAIAGRVLFAGVTGFLDLFGDEDQLIAVRARQASGEIGGADIFASLSCLTATDGHCTEYGIPTRVMNTPEEARAVVSDLARHRPDVIKIVYQPSDDQPSIDLPTFTAAVATAREYGLSTIVHIKTWQDIRDAIQAGATAVTHTPRGPIPEDVPALMAASHLVIIPTLAVGTELTDFVFDPEVLDNPLLRAITSPEIVEAYRSDEVLARWADREEGWRADDAEQLASVGAMAEAGVMILAGTDAGNWGTIQGYSVHRELIKLVAAGLSPWQALAAATTQAGAFLGREYGVEPGDQASLVVLNSSPIDDIAHTQDIAMVIHHGEIIDRDAIARQIAEEVSNASD